MTLSYGPASVTMLSPSTATTRTGTGFRFGNMSVQPDVSAVAVSSDSSTLPPSSSIVRTFHFPATSASEIVADAAGVSGAAAAVSIAVRSSAARSSDLVQPTSTAAQQRKAK